MLYFCLPYQFELYVYHTNTKLDMLCVFGNTGPPWPVDAVLALLRNYMRELSFPTPHRRSVAQFNFAIMTCSINCLVEEKYNVN